MDREEVSFQVAGENCAAWLYHPQGNDETSSPIVVMAHGLSGTRRDGLGAFAERFARAGFAALVFDHRGLGDSGGEPDRFVPARQLEDWAAAIEFARSLEAIDAGRVVTFGSSMGGGNALAAAAVDRRVAAVISQVPFLDLRRQAHRNSFRVNLKILTSALLGGYLPAVGQPDEAAFINAPGSEAGWRHVVSIGENSKWRNRVSARWIVGRPFNPGRVASELHCPWLVCVGDADQVARPGPAINAARRAPHGELRVYEGVDHFDIYDGAEHETLVADQIAFLRRHLVEPGNANLSGAVLPARR
ncbi:MAG: alpha/beta hydrolase [Solirubrobacterales bacterium]